jgi:uncharacterized membrane protein
MPKQPKRSLDRVATRKASALKSVVWRIIGVVILASVSYSFTQRLIVTTKITLTHHAAFLIVFYVYERIWAKLRGPQPPLRNIVKGLFYEIVLGMGLGGVIVYLYTGSIAIVSKVTVTYTICKIIVYIVYDRWWPERSSP